MRRAVLLAAAALVPLAAHAQSGPAAPIAALNASLAAMSHAGGSFASKEAMIAPAVDAALDLPTILRNSVGLRYATIPAADQSKLLATFRAYTLANYVSNFAGSNDGFTVAPGTRTTGSDVVVQTSVVPPSGSPTRIDYVMRNAGSGYKAVDVLLDGTLSRVAVQRSDFRSTFDQGGAAGLEATLQRKTASLSGG